LATLLPEGEGGKMVALLPQEEVGKELDPPG
jgi:hypothetical protein